MFQEALKHTQQHDGITNIPGATVVLYSSQYFTISKLSAHGQNLVSDIQGFLKQKNNKGSTKVRGSRH